MTVCIAGARPVAAQLSPGPLHRVHEHLEGLRNCGNCHALGNREVQERCLACHQEIAAMRSGGGGLHAGSAYGECAQCHVEHQGRTFALVRWPEGRDQFDHKQTGFVLTGSHAGKDCRVCHTSRYVAEPERLVRAGKDLERTFLGLDPACESCHPDPHGGQFRQSCTACHDATSWKPAPLFDHATTDYPLTGRHGEVACRSCHKPLVNQQVVIFAGLAHTHCTDCHRDPHTGTLGPRCGDCHNTGGWRLIQGASFDHDQTGYPLRGRHSQVACADCHQGRGPRPACARCVDCHRDEHGGSTRGRPGWTVCERCHTVDGYRPARFGLADHDTTAFPLRGAHRATPCALCHEPTATRGDGARSDRVDLAPAAATCDACHADVHRWSTDAAPACTICHSEANWRVDSFDHQATRFPLSGRHALVACTGCHRSATDTARSAPTFGGEPLMCSGCHRDVHAGTMTRLSTEVAGTDCARCHVPVDWLAEKFDHDRDSRFALRGAHAKVACRACHKVPAGEALVVFRPLATECGACHAVLPVTEEEGS